MRIFQFLCIMFLFVLSINLDTLAENTDTSDQSTPIHVSTPVHVIGHQATMDFSIALASQSEYTPLVIVTPKKQAPSCSSYECLSDDHFVAPTRQLDIYRSDSNFLTTPFLPLVQRSYSKISVKDRASHKANVVPTRNILFPLRIGMN